MTDQPTDPTPLTTVPSSATELLAVSAKLITQPSADLLEVWQNGTDLYIVLVTGQQFQFSADHIIGRLGADAYNAIQAALAQVLANAAPAAAAAAKSKAKKA